MAHEYIDEMFERLLVFEHLSYKSAFTQIVKERATKVVDLGRIEKAYQLFRKKYPEALENAFREFVRMAMPEDWPKCVRCFNWK